MRVIFVMLSLVGCISLFFLQVSTQSTCGNDSDMWTLYKDEKCFKVLDSFASHDEAIQACRLEIGTKDVNVLPTINSTEEQEFITQLVFGDSGAVDNVWLDAQRGDEDSTKFFWQGGSIPLHFTNWVVGAPSENLNKNCSQMVSSLARSQKDSSSEDIFDDIINPSAFADGQWEDVSCLKRNLVVCQKRPTWSIEQLQETLLQVRLEMETQLENLKTTHSKDKSEIETQVNSLKSNPVPVGFIYVQLPNQAPPNAIWPAVSWADVTSEYAGLFFRAGGGLAAPFGAEQGESSRRIVQVQYSEGVGCVTQGPVDIPRNGGWSGWVANGRHEWSDNVCEASRYLSEESVENRPKNKAVLIWKRTQ